MVELLNISSKLKWFNFKQPAQLVKTLKPSRDKRTQRVFAVSMLTCVLSAWLPLQAQAQSLTEVVQNALTLYPGVLSAKSKTEASRFEIDRARAAHYPQISYGFARNSYASGTLPSGLEANTQSPSVKLNLWSGGRIEAEATRAEALTRGSESKEAMTRDDVALLATEAYINWARAMAMLELATRNFDAHKVTLEDIRKIAQADMGRRIDFQQAQVRMDNAALAKLARQTDVALAHQRLSRFWNRSELKQPQNLKDVLGDAGALASVPASLEQAMAGVSDELPSIAQQKAQVEAAQQAIRVAQAQFWPVVDLVVSRQLNTATLRRDTLTQVQMNMPLYNGGSVSAQVKTAASQLTAAQLALDEVRLLAQERAALAYHEWQAAQARAAQGESQAGVSEKVVEGYRMQFRLARRQLLDLLNIQNESFGYQSAATTAFYDEQIARARLLSAMGGLAKRFAPG
jgi:adhesin transport system outer membrane protein